MNRYAITTSRQGTLLKDVYLVFASCALDAINEVEAKRQQGQLKDEFQARLIASAWPRKISRVRCMTLDITNTERPEVYNTYLMEYKPAISRRYFLFDAGQSVEVSRDEFNQAWQDVAGPEMVP